MRFSHFAKRDSIKNIRISVASLFLLLSAMINTSIIFSAKMLDIRTAYVESSANSKFYQVNKDSSGDNKYSKSEDNKAVESDSSAVFILETDGAIKSTSSKKSEGKLEVETGFIEAKISFAQQEDLPVPIIESDLSQGEDKFIIEVPKKDTFRPGKYHLEINFKATDGREKTISQDFTWGVLAINPDKQPYLPGDEALIAMAVLDDNGNMICDAKVSLEITKPSGVKDVLSTNSGDITVSDECKVRGVTNLPDYYSKYKVEELGNYNLRLSAQTPNGTRELTDQMFVDDKSDFYISREAPTRIYPIESYKAEVSVLSKKAEAGRVKEKLPKSFEVINAGGASVIEEGDSKVLTWSETFAKDEQRNFSYEFRAPPISPEFYLLGPIEIESGAQKYTELRPWQIASDAVINISGVCKQYDRTTNCTDLEVVKVAVNGVLSAVTTTTATGAWTLTGVTANANDIVTVFIDNVADANEANAVAKIAAVPASITGVALYERHLTIGASSNQTLINANLSQYDNSVSTDEDIFFEVDASMNLALPATGTQTATDQQLYLMASNPFNPDAAGGKTITVPNLNIPTSATLTAGANTYNLTASGSPFTRVGTFTATGSTFKYTGAEATTVTAADYYNLETVPASAPAGGGGWVVGGASIDSSYTGAYTASGIMNGYPKYTNGSRWLYYNHYEMPGPGDDWALSSSASDCFDPYVCTAYYQYPGDTSPSTATWYAGMDFSGTPTLAESASSYVYTFASGTFNIGGNYTNGTEGVTVETNATTNDPIINIDGNFSNLAGSNFIASNSAAFSVASNFTNSATGKFTDSGGTLTLDGQGLQTITAGGTDADHDFNNLTITNASTTGVSFADSVNVAGTFTDVTPSSKVTFHSGNTYAFNAININGQETSTRVTLTSSTFGSAWNLNITAASPTASNVSVKDSNANKDIDATTGGYDNTGNTHWLFPVSVYVSGTVYTAENKGSNIGAGKTVALSINGGTKITDETDASGIFRFDDVNIGANNSITLFLDGENEKASLITIAANGTSAISSLEMFTNRIVLTHASAGPMSNTVLATADNACTSDCLFSIDGSSVATFASANEVFIPTAKTYTPGAAIIADDIELDGTLTLAGNAATIHGSWDSADGFFSSSGTVTFDAASGTETLNTGGVGGDGGWTVTNSPGDPSYGGTYTSSGNTFNGQPTYTNGSRWLYYNYDEMSMSNYWVMYSSVTNLMDGGSSAGYYTDATIPGTWYENYMIGNGPAPTIESVTAKGGSFINVTKSGGGVLQLTSNAIDIDGTLTVGSSTTFDINGQNITLATLTNDGTFKLQGAETATITTLDTNSGTVEYSGTSTYSSLLLGDIYAGLKINGTGGTWTLDADLAVSGVLDINAGTLSASSRTITLSGSGTPFIVTGTFSEGTSTVIYTGSSATNVTGSTYKNLKLNHAGTTFTAAGDTLVKSVFTIEAGTFDASNRTITLSGSGTPFVKTGTFVASTSTIAYTSPYDTNITAADYYHLDLIDPPEWLTGWNKRVKVEVLDTNIDSDLTNFPLMLKLGASVGTGSDDTTAVFDEVGSNSQKIAVTTTDGTTEIYVEIEKWDSVGEEAILWVSKSDLVFSGSATTDLYLYYDNNHADNTTHVGATGSRPEVWDSNYTAVYHSNQATDAQMLDSTGDHNATPGTTSGSNPVSTTSGKIGSAFIYNSTDQRRYTTDIVSGTTYTWEVWANASVFNNYHSMLSLSGNYVLFDLAGNALSAWASDGMGGNDGGITGLSTDTFYRMAFVRTADNATEGYKFYKDGVGSGTSYNTGTWSNANPIYIGSRQDVLSQAFDGTLDEVRISSSVRSAAWLKADYFSQTDGLTNWGTEEGAPGSAVYTMGSGTFNIDGDLTIGNSTDEMSVNADTNDPIISVNGSMEITANSTFIASNSAAFSVASNFTNSGIFTDSSGSLTLDGQGLQTITAGGTDGNHDFNNLTTTNASAAGISFADSATVTGTFTDVTPSSKVTFLSGGTYAFNAININGQETGTRVTLTSSSSGTAWNLNITATSPTASNVSVKDSNANKDIDATSGGEDLTGNTHWIFSSTGATISGTVYTAEDKSTNIGAGKNVALSVNGAAATTATTASGGTFSFSSITVAANNTVAIFVDNETEKGSFITQASGTGSITGIEIYTAHVVFSHQTAGPMTNTLLDTADNVTDADLLVSVSTGNATFAVGNEVWVISSKSYTPGGNVEAGSLNIAGTFSPEGNTATLSDSGTPLTITGTFNEGSSTIIYSGLSATNVTGTTYNNLKVNQIGTTFTAAGDITVKAVWTIQAGTFDGSSRTITLSGAGTPFVKTGTFIASTSTVKYTGAGNTTIIAADYSNLETKPSVGGLGDWVVSGAGSGSFDGGYNESGTWGGKAAYTDGSHWISWAWDQSAWCLDENKQQDMIACDYYSWNDNLGNSWTVSQGDSPAPEVSASTPFYTYTFTAGTINVNGNYTNGDGTHIVFTNANTNNPVLNIVGNFSNAAGASFAASSSAALSVASNFSNAATGTFIHSEGTLALDGQGLQTITAGGTDTDHDFNNLTITNASAAGVFFADSVTVAGTFTDVTASSKLTFHALSTYAFAAININGQEMGTKITMVSSDPANGTPANRQWYLNISGTSPQATFVNVTDSDASGGNTITPVTSTNGGNNENWLFGITISGTIYSAEDKGSNIGGGKTVVVSVNGAAVSATAETDTNGAFSLSEVRPATNSVVSIFLSGGAEKASYITQTADGTSDIAGIELFTSHIILTHNTAGPMTNTLLDIADNVADSDLLVAVSANAATFTPGNEVWILGSKTYTPGGNVTCGSLDILSTAAFTPEANTVTFTDSGTPFSIIGTFNEGTSTVIYTGPSATNVTGTTYNNLKVNQSGTTFTAAGDLAVKSVWTIQAGTFDGSSRTITLNGSGTPFVKTGTFTASSSTVKYEVSSSTDITAADYNNLELIDPPLKNLSTSTGQSAISNINRYLGLEKEIGGNYQTIAQGDTSGTLKAAPEEKEIENKRTRNFKTFAKADGTFRIGGDINPIHYRENPYDNTERYKEINLNIVETPLADYDYAMQQNGYQAYFWNQKTDTGTSYTARFKRAGHYLDMAPLALVWQNDLGEQEVVSKVVSQSKDPIIDNLNHTIKWVDAFGAGIDYSYNVSPDRFFKTVIVNRPEALTKPFISEKGLKLTVLMSLAWDSGVNLSSDFASGVETKLSNTTIDEISNILKNPGDLTATDDLQRSLWSFPEPLAWDSNQEVSPIEAEWNISSSNDKVLASISVPREFVNSDNYPIFIDAAMTEEQTSAAGDDGIHSTDPLTSEHSLTTSFATRPFGYNASPIFHWETDLWARFTTIPIPAGCSIDTASLSVMSSSDQASSTVNARIYANDVDDATAPTTDSEYDNLSWTTNYSDWSNVPSWSANTWYETPDVASSLAEVVARAGWSVNNDVLFSIKNNSSTSGATRWLYTYEQTGNSSGPKLNVTYTEPKVLTLSSGEFNIAGNFIIGNGTDATEVTADSNDPAINVDGSMSILANGAFIASASSALSVASNFTNSATGKFTDSGATLSLNGQGLQTITAGGTDADHDFNNLTITNGSTAGVSFADSATVTGTFTDVTPSSKVTFHSTSTYAFNAININGQAESTRITLISSNSGSAWNLNITAVSPAASNVSVKDSNANKDIDATSGGEDLTGNTHWLFNTSPSNDSLTFTNPYSSNIAIADNTTEWNFRALVTDNDGVANVNYVELRLANLADSAQPYDSIKLRWTQGTDTFSEIADTQDAITLTGTSSGSANQKTLNFNIKIDNDFLTKNTNYAAELYAIDDSSATDTDNYPDKFQVQALSITFAVDSNTLSFGNLLPGSVITGTTVGAVTTNYPNGYTLSVKDDVANTDSVLLHSDTSTRIADYGATIDSPALWSGTGLGICVYSATGKDTLQWGTGTTADDSNNKYAGVPQNSTIIHSKTGSPSSNDQTNVGYKLVVPNTQKTGSYSGILTYTATGTLR